jgi:ElaB/YqjD/DUF883 family membrane-anchored ribosome-binding protein
MQKQSDSCGDVDAATSAGTYWTVRWNLPALPTVIGFSSITGAAVAKRKSKTKPLDQKLSALRADLDALQDDMKSVVGDVGNVATDAAKAAVASAREIAERAYRLADETRETVTDEFEEWSDENIESIREQVRSKPMYAVGLSLLAGAIVGAILSRL